MTATKKRADPRVDKDQLQETLEDTFPASDAPSGNVIEKKATRPAHRRPADLDTATVDRLAREAREKVGKG